MHSTNCHSSTTRSPQIPFRLELAHDRTANRLTIAIAGYLAGDETDEERDQRLHDNRSVTVYTDADGMLIIRESLNAVSGQNASADASDGPTMQEQLCQLKHQWQPADDDGFVMPSLAQQRADAFMLVFLGKNIELTTEVVIHVRGDGTTFNDGTPVTNNAVYQRLDQSFIRLLLHDIEGKPIDASNRRRHPTTRQKRVVLEAHNHECVDCQSPDLLELDHNPPYEQTRHTITTELEPRCAPCHRARHRCEALARL